MNGENLEIFELKLAFDISTGELVQVESLGGQSPKPEDYIDITRLALKVKKATTHSILFSWGSPGCVTFKTRNGYVTICK